MLAKPKQLNFDETDGLENPSVSKAEDEEFNEMINITNPMVDDVEHSAILCGVSIFFLFFIL